MFVTKIKKLIPIATAIWVGAANGQGTFQALQPYPQNWPVLAAKAPRHDRIVFQADYWNGSGQPSIGTACTLTRASTQTYYDTPTTLATASSGNIAGPAFPLNGSGAYGGIYIGGDRKNEILQSEAPATTWTVVGAPTSVNNSVGTFLGTISYGTIVSTASAQGIQQSSGITAANKAFTGSVYLSVASGTLSVALVLEGDSGGTPQTKTTNVVATTTPTRYSVNKSFTGATGNARFKITTNAAGTLRLGGMQLERTDNGVSTGSNMTVPSAYIKTTTVTVTVAADALLCPSANMTRIVNNGTISLWVNASYTDAQVVDEKDWISMGPGNATALSIVASGGLVTAFYSGESGPGVTTLSAGVWYHFVYTWAHTSGTNAATLHLYKYATDLGPFTTAAVAEPTANTFYVGQEGGLGPTLGGETIISGLKVWDVALSQAEVTALYTQEKGRYGL